jgi:hypothetical protein
VKASTASSPRGQGKEGPDDRVGVSILLVATALGGPSMPARVVLIVALLAITTPVAAHAIAQAAYHQREPMRAPGAVDERPSVVLFSMTNHDGRQG